LRVPQGARDGLENCLPAASTSWIYYTQVPLPCRDGDDWLSRIEVRSGPTPTAQP
jgi:hypothetical protein